MPPLATGKVPVTPVVKGNPVALVSVPLDGVPKAPPLTTKAPAVPVFTPSAVTTPVPVVTVAGATPAPPPTTKALAAKAADVAQVVPLLKYGTPPEVPAIVNAGVVVPVATDTIPPVQPTEVTVPEPLPLNVVQSAAVSKPRLVADDEGKLSVMTGVVVPVAMEDETSVPVVPKVSAATDVTVPEPLPLNVVQSAAVSAPRLVADADGRLSVMTGVVVPVATVDETSVPVVPKVNAATEVTVPLPPVAAIVIEPDAFVMLTPLPAVNVVRVNPVPLPMSSAPFAGVVVRPVPPEATAKVADSPAAVPEVFWLNVGQVNVPVLKLPDVGVPSTGVTNVGDVAKATTDPVPVVL